MSKKDPSQNIPVPAQDDEEEPYYIELEDMKGNKVKFELLDVVPYNDTDYLAVVPAEGDDDDMIQIYRIEPNLEDDTETYLGLDSEEELNAVYEEFKKRNKDLYELED